MTRRRRTPQEKKRSSLDQDRPLAAKYPKAFRKQWPRTKARAERARRRAERVALASGRDEVVVRREEKRKWPQPTLRDAIAARAERRAQLQAEPRKPAVARLRRARKRGRARTRA